MRQNVDEVCGGPCGPDDNYLQCDKQAHSGLNQQLCACIICTCAPPPQALCGVGMQVLGHHCAAAADRYCSLRDDATPPPTATPPPPTPDTPCANAKHGLDCSCDTPVDFPADSPLSPVLVSITSDDATGDVTVSASSGSTGALQHEDRTVTKTEVRVQKAAGDWCTLTLTRSDMSCTACDAGPDPSDPYSCGNTSPITLAALQAACGAGATLFTETIPGTTDQQGLQVQAEVFYEDVLSDLFGNPVGDPASHSSSATAFIAVGGVQTTRTAATGDASFVDVRMAGASSISTPDGTTSQMTLTILVTHELGTSVTVASPQVTSSQPGMDTVASVAGGAVSEVCTSSACSSTTQVTVFEAADACEFGGSFTVDLTIGGDTATYTFTLSSTAGTNACTASVIGATGSLVSVLTAEPPVSNGVLGVGDGSVVFSWTTAAQLDSDPGTNVESEVTSVEMVLQQPGDACTDPDAISSLATVYDTDGTTLLSGDSGNLVTVAAAGDSISFELGTSNIPDLANIDNGAGAFDAMKSTYTAQLCVVVTRTAQVGVSLPERVLRTAMVRSLSDISAEAAGSSTATIKLAHPSECARGARVG